MPELAVAVAEAMDEFQSQRGHVNIYLRADSRMALSQPATLAAGSMDAGSLGMMEIAPFRPISTRAGTPAYLTARSTLETLRWVNREGPRIQIDATLIVICAFARFAALASSPNHLFG
jgi:hypothetical protein